MFIAARVFNGDISQWNVSSVRNMNGMFAGADAFNGDISQWDVSSVSTMVYMFLNTIDFNVDISQWDVSSVRFARQMFDGATSFNQNLCNFGKQWSASNVAMSNRLRDMFSSTPSCPADHDAFTVSEGPYCHECSLPLDG